MNKFITHIDYVWPKEILLQEFDKLEKGMVLAGYPGSEVDGMYVSTVSDTVKDIVQEFMDHFGITYDYHIGFLLVKADCVLPWHKDTPDREEYENFSLLCAINQVLSPEIAEPIQFKDTDDSVYEYKYSTALLNIKEYHRVVNGANDRKILRIYFTNKDASYNNVREILNTHRI